MQGTHLTKALAVAALLAGAWPLLCFALVGVAAALYAPARYGWVTEVTPSPLLVRANAWLEIGLVGAGLMGTVLGGALISPAWLTAVTGAFSGGVLPTTAALSVLCACYALAWLLNLAVPPSGWLPTQPPDPTLNPLREFRAAHRLLWSDRKGGRVSLAATTLLWGVGAVLQLMILQWATVRLDLALHQAAYLQALIAVGMVVGAVWAGRHVRLENATRGLRVGMALGLLLPMASLTTHFAVAALCLTLAGAAAGYTVIPLNALLQHRGVQLLTPGRSIAVQMFNENASILLMLSVYALLARLEVAPVTVMWLLGLAVAAAMLLLMRWAKRQSV
jgi:MFS family permease